MTKPLEAFVTNELNKYGPVRLYQNVWRSSLEKLLLENFQHQQWNGTPVWTVYLCLGRAQDSNTDEDDEDVASQEVTAARTRFSKGGKGKGKARVKQEDSEEKKPLIKQESSGGSSHFCANDGTRSSWLMEGERPIRPKGNGRSIVVSDFLTPMGRLANAAVLLETGKDKWFTSEMFVKQVGTAVGHFKEQFPAV